MIDSIVNPITLDFNGDQMISKKSKKYLDPFYVGLIGSVSLLVVYFLIVALAESAAHAISQFIDLWYLIVPLVVGFGIQVGLFYYIRKELKHRQQNASASMVASGGVSTTSMVACCAHHLTDVLPILGLSAAAMFLSTYQIFFMLLGVLSNLVGILLMLEIIKRHNLVRKDSNLRWLVGFNLKNLRNGLIVVSGLLLLFTALDATSDKAFDSTPAETKAVTEVPKDTPAQTSTLPNPGLPSKTNDLNGVSIEVKPLDVSDLGPVSFKIHLNTHSGSLDYDLTQVSLLRDDLGNTYYPLSWDGSPSGGHHRSGLLTFPSLKGSAQQIRLTLKGIYGVPERVFEWGLK